MRLPIIRSAFSKTLGKSSSTDGRRDGGQENSAQACQRPSNGSTTSHLFGWPGFAISGPGLDDRQKVVQLVF